MIVSIYKLCDPRDVSNSPKYIGITKNSLKIRLSQHCSYLSSNTHKNNWIKKLLKEGVTPSIILINRCMSWETACKIEKFWIKYYKEKGYKLTNTTDGGDGSCGVTPSKKVIEKITNKTRGQKRSKEFCDAVSKRTKGRLVSQETRDKLRQINLGNKISEETKRKISLATKGKKKTKEQIEKSRIRLIGHTVTEETRKKLKEINEKAIIIYYDNGIIEEYRSIKIATEKTKISSFVFWVCLKKSNTGRYKNRDFIVKYK